MSKNTLPPCQDDLYSRPFDVFRRRDSKSDDSVVLMNACDWRDNQFLTSSRWPQIIVETSSFELLVGVLISMMQCNFNQLWNRLAVFTSTIET